MSMTQLKLFSSVEMSKIQIDKPVKQKRDLTKRFVLSIENSEKYNFPLKKDDLIKTCKFYNEELVGRSIRRRGLFPLGIPQMLLTILSQFSGKKQGELSALDLVVMYNSIRQVLSDQEIEDRGIKKWRIANGLSFFGDGQYWFMREYIEDNYI